MKTKIFLLLSVAILLVACEKDPVLVYKNIDTSNFQHRSNYELAKFESVSELDVVKHEGEISVSNGELGLSYNTNSGILKSGGSYDVGDMILTDETEIWLQDDMIFYIEPKTEYDVEVSWIYEADPKILFKYWAENVNILWFCKTIEPDGSYGYLYMWNLLPGSVNTNPENPFTEEQQKKIIHRYTPEEILDVNSDFYVTFKSWFTESIRTPEMFIETIINYAIYYMESKFSIEIYVSYNAYEPVKEIYEKSKDVNNSLIFPGQIPINYTWENRKPLMWDSSWNNFDEARINNWQHFKSTMKNDYGVFFHDPSFDIESANPEYDNYNRFNFRLHNENSIPGTKLKIKDFKLTKRS